MRLASVCSSHSVGVAEVRRRGTCGALVLGRHPREAFDVLRRPPHDQKRPARESNRTRGCADGTRPSEGQLGSQQEGVKNAPRGSSIDPARGLTTTSGEEACLDEPLLGNPIGLSVVGHVQTNVGSPVPGTGSVSARVVAGSTARRDASRVEDRVHPGLLHPSLHVTPFVLGHTTTRVGVVCERRCGRQHDCSSQGHYPCYNQWADRHQNLQEEVGFVPRTRSSVGIAALGRGTWRVYPSLARAPGRKEPVGDPP